MALVLDPTDSSGAGWTVTNTVGADGKTKVTVTDNTGYVMAEGSKAEVASRLSSIPQSNFTKSVVAEVNNAPADVPPTTPVSPPADSSATIAKDYNGAVQTDATGRINPNTVAGATPTILGGNMLNPDGTIAPDFSLKKEVDDVSSKDANGVSAKDKQEFLPAPNILSQYANYSYTVGLYIS
jgi:hypothetical protein